MVPAEADSRCVLISAASTPTRHLQEGVTFATMTLSTLNDRASLRLLRERCQAEADSRLKSHARLCRPLAP